MILLFFFFLPCKQDDYQVAILFRVHMGARSKKTNLPSPKKVLEFIARIQAYVKDPRLGSIGRFHEGQGPGTTQLIRTKISFTSYSLETNGILSLFNLPISLHLSLSLSPSLSQLRLLLDWAAQATLISPSSEGGEVQD